MNKLIREIDAEVQSLASQRSDAQRDARGHLVTLAKGLTTALGDVTARDLTSELVGVTRWKPPQECPK